MKSSYNNNKFETSSPTWSEEFKLLNESYSISDIQDYFEYISKQHSESVDDPSVRIYVNKIGNRITFQVKRGYHLELLIPETMKLLGSKNIVYFCTKQDIRQFIKHFAKKSYSFKNI